jgi:hypothetical protein
VFAVIGHHTYFTVGTFQTTVTIVDIGGQSIVAQDVSLQIFTNQGT